MPRGCDGGYDASHLERVSEVLLETACVFYNILLTFPGLGETPEDRSMLLRPCILHYIINVPWS